MPQIGANLRSVDDIIARQDWGKDMDNHDKVPSVYSYTPRVGTEQNWGSSLGPDAIAMIHTKLELDVQSIPDELDFILKTLAGVKNLHFEDGVMQVPDERRRYPDSSSEQIVTDYMKKVFEYLQQENVLLSQEIRENISTDIVITVPTVSLLLSLNFPD
jgi:hypothetical protein